MNWHDIYEVSYVAGLGSKVPCTLGWPYTYWVYLIVLWLLYLVCILYCGCF